MSTMYRLLIEEAMSCPRASILEPLQAVDTLAARNYFRWKGIMDRLLAAVLLIPALPLIGALVLLIRLNSRGPGIFRQVRLGKDGREYVMFKLRSMRLDAEARTGAVWSPANDPRVTRLGRFLRNSHLDELPQLFNVLRGEMSLIGPRPERPEIVGVLEGEIPGYRNRLKVLPGVTGLAQINQSADTDLYSVRCKLVLDVQYIAEASLFFDLRILLCTSLRLVGCPGDLAKRLTRLHREVVLPKGINGHRMDLGLLCPQDASVVRSVDTTATDEDDAMAVKTVRLGEMAELARIADLGSEPQSEADGGRPDRIPAELTSEPSWRGKPR
jgi:lipopolysaccharide/colanic/teichoic acid biosynthesis glycosyltransferase